MRAHLIAVLARAGRRAESDALLAQVLDEEKHRYVSPYDLARAHAERGELDQSLARLEQARNERAAGLRELGVDPGFDVLRGDPRFVRILEQVSQVTR